MVNNNLDIVKWNTKLNLLKKQVQQYFDDVSVVCVLEFKNNEIIKGNNIISSSYPCGICAEQSALTQVISQNKKFENIKNIYVSGNIDQNIYPCGKCAQLLSDYINDGIYVHLFNNKGYTESLKIKEILPYHFKLG